MNKFKIVRRESFQNGCYYTAYDVYEGFTGIPATWPFMTKWIPDKIGITEDEMLHHMKMHLTTVGKIKIIIKSV